MFNNAPKPNNKYGPKDWSPERVQEFRAMWDDPRCTMKRTAAHFDIETANLRAARLRFGFPSRRAANVGHHWSPADDQILRDKWMTHSMSQLAAMIGVTRNSIIGRVRRIGLPLKTRDADGNPLPREVKARQPRRRPRRAPRLRTLELLLTDDVLPKNVTFMELTSENCHWPTLDTPQGVPTHFCGNPASPGFSYCASHARMAYRLPARAAARVAT